MLNPTIFNTSQVCQQLGVSDAVMSPGSRNAPLTISFARNDNIRKWVIPDERSAGFIAVGIAQMTKKPVVLCCTSGSALLNYAPAVAEAYYREIPLIVLSADRPPELIDQRDGQTIRQFKALDNHVKGSWQLPVVITEKEENRYTEELIAALVHANTLPKGPVHVNIPFREPFYPTPDQVLAFRHIELRSNVNGNEKSSSKTLQVTGKVLLLVGQYDRDPEMNDFIDKLSQQLPVLSNPLSNLLNGIRNYDAFINNQDSLTPDVLITFGLSVLSKKTKNWIRNNKPKRHIHIDPANIKVDTFQTNPEILVANPLDQLSAIEFSDLDTEYLAKWKKYSAAAARAVSDRCAEGDFSEVHAAYKILSSLPENIALHLSNSMPVRYADLFDVNKGVRVHSNRGTSGIDGCTSTMLGSAMVSNDLHVLLTGDVAFFYDRNAFFHNHLPSNFRVIVLNNQGGGIFRLIDGPKQLPELESYFETRHHRTARQVCEENQLGYKPIHTLKELENGLTDFFHTHSDIRILEIFTDPKTNEKEYKQLKTFIHERIND